MANKLLNKSQEKAISNVKQRKYLYNRLSKYTPKAIKTIVKLLDDPKPNIRLKAGQIILNKTLPDLRSVEIEGEVNSKVMVNVVKGYLQDAQSAIDGVIVKDETPVVTGKSSGKSDEGTSRGGGVKKHQAET